MTEHPEVIRIAAVADTHCDKNSQGRFQALFAHASATCDVLLICGDITDYGLPEEAQIFAREITSSLKIPAVAVLGNHDFQSGKQDAVSHVLAEAGVTILDGDAREVRGVGFAGTKGFAGGFDARSLQPWGEDSIKHFVREAVDESLKLESALAKLRTPQRFVLLHYAPVRGTVEGEPLEIFPFLGSSRLEEPLDRYSVTAVFHGHAHHGALSSKTRGGAAVYNVAMPLLKRSFPDRPTVFRLDVPLSGEVTEAPANTLSTGAER